MQIADILYPGFFSECIIQVHGTAAGYKEDMFYALVCQRLEDVIGNSHFLQKSLMVEIM
jgi:hypothetical protein